jgi:hypothetical protein
MVTIEEILVHPITLLLIGAGVSSVLIPWFTNKSTFRPPPSYVMIDIDRGHFGDDEQQFQQAVAASLIGFSVTMGNSSLNRQDLTAPMSQDF